ncbi:unnamed protein product [Rotaria sordida]|uniref:Trichoplein keratin filament-binding protein n=2 Tax=Rotaria sordida TaxID=392033 RepID=A0A814NZF2_9BILA|nr:unnamed protein product [Rotaria sordida]
MIQRQQEIEIEKNTAKPQTTTYVNAQTRYNSAHSKLASPISGALSDDALRIEQEKQDKLNRLQQRRTHLSAILEAEKTKYQNVLASTRQSSRESMPYMKIGDNSLHSAHETERQTIVHEKNNKHGTINNPSLCSIEQKLENLQPEYWSEQHNEIHLVQEEEEEEENNVKYQQELRHDLYEQDKQEENKRTNRIQQLKIILQQQMDELKQKEEKSEILKQEEEHLFREQSQLDQHEEERKQIEKCHIQKDDRHPLLRQHKIKFHKRSKEIQEHLELDMKILESIAHVDNENYLKQSEQREPLRQNALNMLKQFQQQMKFEKEKEQELDGMFPEEIAKQWSRREQEWNREKESREKLIRQIIDKRHEQIMEKLQILKEQQQEIYERQRILIDDMQQARKYDLIEQQKQAKEREEKKQNSSRQISILEQERTHSRLELEKQDTMKSEDKKQMHDSVQKPQASITTTTVEPKFYGRRRVNWN